MALYHAPTILKGEPLNVCPIDVSPEADTGIVMDVR
nr:MAG TPA: hypothetical protein [Bacteriophage sp.]DAU52605.1 MAG TPA: hypothetical protein [Crassvirales sp.]